MQMNLERRSAIVTGGAQGIGLACVRSLIEEGARVAVADLNAELAQAAAAKFPGKAIPITCDVSDSESVAAMIDRAEAEFGPISVLVNNAGIAIGGNFLELA